MQRLFSTFPNGWPGCGLLLLRVTCAASWWVMGTSAGFVSPAHTPLWLTLAGCVTAVLIVGGLWTPIAALVHAILQLALAFAGAELALNLLMALNGASLVMLGPGAWSIDARRYGRKRIDLGAG